MNHSQFLQQKFFSNLDGVRAISVLAVIWHHTASKFLEGPTIINQGYHGVSLFFVISGFIITTLLLREKSEKEINLRKFYIRRSLRIFPLYYAVIVLYVLAVFLFEKDSIYGEQFYSNLKYYLTYTSNIFVPLIIGERVIFYFAWSLAVEEQFYAIWPWVEKYLSLDTVILLIICIILFIIGIQSGLYLQSDLGNLITKILVLPICFGVLLAHLLHEKRYYLYLSKFLTNKSFSVFYLFGMIFFLSNPEINSIYLYLFMTLFIGSIVINPESLLSAFLCNRQLAHIGTISYGVYLTHMLCFNMIKKVSQAADIEHWLIFFLGTSILSIVVATISYNTYEMYFLRLKSKYG